MADQAMAKIIIDDLNRQLAEKDKEINDLRSELGYGKTGIKVNLPKLLVEKDKRIKQLKAEKFKAEEWGKGWANKAAELENTIDDLKAKEEEVRKWAIFWSGKQFSPKALYELRDILDKKALRGSELKAKGVEGGDKK